MSTQRRLSTSASMVRASVLSTAFRVPAGGQVGPPSVGHRDPQPKTTTATTASPSLPSGAGSTSTPVSRDSLPGHCGGPGSIPHVLGPAGSSPRRDYHRCPQTSPRVPWDSITLGGSPCSTFPRLKKAPENQEQSSSPSSWGTGPRPHLKRSGDSEPGRCRLPEGQRGPPPDTGHPSADVRRATEEPRHRSLPTGAGTWLTLRAICHRSLPGKGAQPAPRVPALSCQKSQL